MPDEIRAFAPATVANLGSGFDILGMAVEGLGDTVTVRRQTSGVWIDKITGDGGQLPTDPAKNTAAIAAQYVLNQIGVNSGLSIEIDKGLPLASGLGSSAASAVAAAFATNALFDYPLATGGLLPACLEAEAFVSGRHADNVAPSLFGGIVLIAGIEAELLYSLPVPDKLIFALVTPDVAVPTAEARAVLPKMVPLKDAISQTMAVAQLVHALHKDDLDLLITAMAGDVLIEPARKSLIPHFDEARRVALEAGATAMIISGAGPTLCILGKAKEAIEAGGLAVQSLYESHGIGARLHIGQPALKGAHIVK